MKSPNVWECHSLRKLWANKCLNGVLKKQPVISYGPTKTVKELSERIDCSSPLKQKQVPISPPSNQNLPLLITAGYPPGPQLPNHIGLIGFLSTPVTFLAIHLLREQ